MSTHVINNLTKLVLYTYNVKMDPEDITNISDDSCVAEIVSASASCSSDSGCISGHKSENGGMDSETWYDSENDWTMVDPEVLAHRLFGFGTPKNIYLPVDQRFPDNYLTQKRKRESELDVTQKTKKERREALRKKYDPQHVLWLDGYFANCWLEYMGSDISRGLYYFENAKVYRDWLWGIRRSHNMSLMYKEKSGLTQGWTTLARIFLLESQIKANLFRGAFSNIYYVKKNILKELVKASLVHTLRSIHEYDELDILMALRLIARAWTSENIWKCGITTTVKWLELLLYDLNLKSLEYVLTVDNDNSEGSQSPKPRQGKKEMKINRNYIFEVAHMTSFYHYMILFWKDKIVPNLFTEEELCDYRENSIPRKFVHGLDDDEKWTMYQTCYDNICKYLQTEFLMVAKMGIITRNVFGALRYLLMPYDIFVRYNNKVNRDTSDGVLASEVVLSQTETNYLDFEMGSNKDETLLNASSIDSERKWLFETICIVKLGDDLLCQYNLEYKWSGDTVIYDRDLWRIGAEEIFLSRLPVILIFGCQVIFIFRRKAMIVRNIYEAFMLWVFTIYEEFESKVPMDEGIIFDLDKEIRKLIDICFDGIKHVDRLEFGDEELIDIHDTDSNLETDYDSGDENSDSNSNVNIDSDFFDDLETERSNDILDKSKS